MLLATWLVIEPVFGAKTAATILAVLTILGGHRIFYEAFSGLFRWQISADLAVAIAAIAALAIREYYAAAEVIFIMLVGGTLESFAVSRTRGAIQKLAKISPKTAKVCREGEETEIDVAEVRTGDIVIVRPGERLPVDGVVESGISTVDESAITGESMPAQKEPGSDVFAGTVNEHGSIDVRAVSVGAETLLARIIRLVEDAQESKAPTQRLADRYATYFVPVVLAAAIVTFLVTRDVIRAAAVLIVACPCALVLATPTGIVAGIGRLALEGVLVKGGEFLEKLGRVDAVVFDKTGTLTQGKLRVTDVVAFGGRNEADVLALAAASEDRSEHALGRVVVEEAQRRGCAPSPAERFEARPGRGVEAVVGGQRVLVGNEKLLAEAGVPMPSDTSLRVEALEGDGKTVMVVAAGDEVVGAVAARDEIRPEARDVIRDVRELGIDSVMVLTGDRERVAQIVAREADIRDCAAELLPDAKVAKIEEMQRGGATVAMLGDGINDAPSLAVADVGIAMGGIGTDVAIEAADIIFMADDLRKLPTALQLSRRALHTVRQNIIAFALVFNAVAVAAAAWGYLAPVAAAIVHQVSSLLVVGNSLRLLAVGKTRAAVHDFVAQHVWEPMLARRRAALRWAATIAVAGYVASGIYSIRPGQVGLVRRFGKPIAHEFGPGLHYRLPWPVGKLTKVPVDLIRTVEIGFRATPQATTLAPRLYEWGVQHEAAGFEGQADEATMITGDENLLQVNAIVQYRVTPEGASRFAFGLLSDADTLVRAAAEAALRLAIGRMTLENILTARLSEIERHTSTALNAWLKTYDVGISATGVLVRDIHPPLEIVDAYRSVSSARQERDRRVNEAMGEAGERVILARGRAEADVETARADAVRKSLKARGDAARFEARQAAYAEAPQVTHTRLFLETVEKTLPSVQLTIVDSSRRGRNRITFMRPGGLAAELKPLLEQSLTAQPAQRPEYEEEE